MPLSPETFANVVAIYQGEIDSLIENLGKNVTIYFKPTVVNTPQGMHDPIRGGNRRPDFSDSMAQPTVTQNTRIIKALLKASPIDFETFGVKVRNPQGVIRLKTFLTDVPDLVRCDYIIPNIETRQIVEAKYRLVREPIPVGLKHDRYAISYWERA